MSARTYSRCRAVADLIREAESVAVLTGAGVSVASGIPDFRSRGGLWERYPIEEYGTIEAFERDPDKVWGMNFAIYEGFGECGPNPAHEALGDLEKHAAVAAVITQNIDGLHQAGGSSQVIELHGDMRRFACLPCGEKFPAADFDLGSREPPRCPLCGAVMKPNVIYFGELLPPGVFEQAEAAVLASDVLLVAGTSAVVHPAAGLPALARGHGAAVCEFNLEATNLTHSGQVAHFVEGPVEESLPYLVSLLGA